MTDFRSCPPQTGNAPGLDMDVIASLRELGGDDDPDLLDDLLDTFMADSPPRVQAIKEAQLRGDADSLCRAAHGLKSSAGNMGAMRLSELCRSLEMSARAGELAGTDRVVEQLKKEYETVQTAFADLKSHPPTT